MPQVAHILGWGGLFITTFMFVKAKIYVCVCMYVYMHVCVYVYIHIFTCICTHTHTHTRFEGSQTLKSSYSSQFLHKSSFWAQAPVPMPGPDPGPGRERENSHQGCGELAQQALGSMYEVRALSIPILCLWGSSKRQFTMVGRLCAW